MSLVLLITAQLAFGMELDIEVFKFTSPSKKPPITEDSGMVTELTECHAYIYIDKFGEFKKMFWECPKLQGGLYGKIY